MSACKCFPPNDTWLKIPDEGEILLCRAKLAEFMCVPIKKSENEPNIKK